MDKTKRDTKTRFVAVRMTQQQGRSLDDIARRERINASEVLRRLIERAALGQVAGNAP